MFSIFCFSQNADKLLLDSYSVEELKIIKSTAPKKYDLLVYALEHATYLTDFNAEKHSQLNLKEFLEVSDKPTFTDLHVKIEPFNQYFYAPTLNKIVVVKSEWVLSFEKSKDE